MVPDVGKLRRLFFSGIGGSGMSALAQVLNQGGREISGSDRRNDREESPELFRRLSAQGIRLFPQDGSGVGPDLDAVVISAAVEQDTPDYRRALELGLTVLPRPALLAALVNSRRGVCFAGTSGKSTASALAAFALTELGFHPGVITGAPLVNYQDGPTLGNALPGAGELYVVESCESDGSLVDYRPSVGVILNIERDHHELDRLLEMFSLFAAATRERLIWNADCPNTASLGLGDRSGLARTVSFGIDNPAAALRAGNLRPGPLSCRFSVGSLELETPLPGKYNVYNTLAALAACEAVGAGREDFARVLPGFRGTARRFQVVGRAAGVTVIDDYAHNPAKVRAVLSAFSSWPGLGRLIVVFQPHGYAPTRFFLEELVEAFIGSLSVRDLLVLPEIYYAGGTVARDISSRDIAGRVEEGGRSARFFERRADSAPFIAREAAPGDVVLVLGARDDSLTVFCRDVLAALAQKDSL
jgi:UDP-N-acetylmuramate--alanine ligase